MSLYDDDRSAAIGKDPSVNEKSKDFPLKREIAALRNKCHVCHGDGFHRVTATLLGGPCHKCKGTGSASPDGKQP